jgi:hypothetical protein
MRSVVDPATNTLELAALPLPDAVEVALPDPEVEVP